MKKRKFLLGLAVLSSLLTVGSLVVSCSGDISFNVDTPDPTDPDNPTDPDDPENPGTGDEPDEPVEPDPVVDKYLEIVSYPTQTSFTIYDYFTVNGLVVEKVEETDGVETFRDTVDSGDYDLSIPAGTQLTEVTEDLVVTLKLLSDPDGEYGSVSLHFIVNDFVRHTATFVDDEGTQLYQVSVIDGQFATYVGATPSKTYTGDDYAYSFQGWYVQGDESQTLVTLSSYAITEDVTFVTKFSLVDLSGTDGTFSYAWSDDRNGYIITSFSLTDSLTGATNYDVVVPDTFNGAEVVGIDNSPTNNYGVFYNSSSSLRSTVQSITLGANIQYVGKGTFYGLSNSELTITLNDGLEELGEQCFRAATGLTSITIPGTVKHIPYWCFYGATALSEITLNEGVESLDTQVFNSTKITTLTLPNSLTSFSTQTFMTVSSLTTVNIGAGLTGDTIGDSGLFSASSIGLTNITVSDDNPYLKTDDGYSLLSKDGTILYGVARYGGNRDADGNFTDDGVYTVPSGVEVIGAYAFNYFKDGGWNGIVLGADVKEAQAYAFANNSGTMTMTFNDKLEVIGTYAFSYFYHTSGGKSLTELVMPDSVTTIDDYAFYYCNALTSFTFGANMQNFGQDMFDRCSITTYSINNPQYLQVYSDNVLISADGTEIVYVMPNSTGASTFNMPNTVTKVTKAAFYENSVITEMTLSTNLETIEESAFENTAIASGLVLPSTLTYIGDRAFYGSRSITSIDYSNSATYIGTSAFYNVTATFTNSVVVNEGTTIGESVFYGTTGLTEATINVELTASLFRGSGLTKVTLGSQLTTLPTNVFYSCSSLEEISIPESVTTIGTSALYGASSLTSITLPENLETIGNTALQGVGLTELTIPSKVTSIGTSAFRESTSLTTVVFNNTLSEIPSTAFYGDTALKNITWPQGLTGINAQAFQACGFESVTVPSGVTTMGNQVFYNCTSLKEATLPNTLISLGTSTFYGCTSLTSVDLGEGLTSLPGSTFNGCSSLTSVTLPSSITTIGTSAFYGTAITEFTLNEGVTFASGASSVFYNATSLTTVNWNSTTQTSIGSNFFYGASSLNTFNLGAGATITSIGSAAFRATAFTSTPFDMSNVTSIGTNAFYGCTRLQSFELPTNSSFTSISNYTFYGCTSLESIEIPENVTSIGTQVFRNNTSLTEVTIKNGGISSSSSSTTNAPFNGCTYLETVNFYGTQAQAETLLIGTKFFGATTLTGVQINLYDASTGSLSMTGTYSSSAGAITWNL